MSEKKIEQLLNRRKFVSCALALSGTAVAASMLGVSNAWGAAPKSLDPIDPDIRFGITGALWGDWPNGNLRMSTDMQQIISDTARFGLQGIEPYSGQVVQFLGKPLALKQMCNAAGITLIDVGDLPRARPAPTPAGGGRAPNPGPNPWINAEGNAALIAGMVNFARDFLAPCGCDHWKTNMGSRPEGGPSDDQLKTLANTLNEIGRQTIAFKVRLAPHPHIWGPMEREHEIRRVMALTDPKYVWLTADTAHLTLGGGDAVQIISDYFPRIAEVHMKDTYPNYRGNTSTPTRGTAPQGKSVPQSRCRRRGLPRHFQGVTRSKVQGMGRLRSRCAPAGRRNRQHPGQSCGQHQLFEKCPACEIPRIAASEQMRAGFDVTGRRVQQIHGRRVPHPPGFPIKRCRPAGYETGRFLSSAESATNPWVPHPSRFLRRVGYHESRYRPPRIPPFAKNAKDGAPVLSLCFLPCSTQQVFKKQRAFQSSSSVETAC